jgi:hypothetical protein
MKKILLTIALAGLFFAGNSYAQETTEKTSALKVQQGNFVDANNDGVCDNWQSRPEGGRKLNFVDKNNDGICDNVSERGGKGKGFRNGNKGRNQQNCAQGNGQRARQQNRNAVAPGTK